jgi:hypothetical protein
VPGSKLAQPCHAIQPDVDLPGNDAATVRLDAAMVEHGLTLVQPDAVKTAHGSCSVRLDDLL